MTIEPGRILVADDNLINLKLLRRMLEEQGHRVATAEHGQAALELLHAEAFDLLLLDILMPELDGYQVLAQMQADPILRYIPVIVISAVDELDSVVRCIEMGAEDYLPKLLNRVILRARISACLEKKRLRDKEQLYLKGLERELAIGRQIQAGFLPDRLPQPSGWELAARLQPAREVGGDFYDAFPLAQDQKVGLVVADVSGKGVGAALFMTLFRTLIRATSNLDSFTHRSDGAFAVVDRSDGGSTSVATLQSTFALTNNYIADTHRQSHMFVTLFFGILDLTSGALSYINGGHNPPMIVGPAGVKAYLNPTGPVVGLFGGIDFRVQEIHLEPGDTLFAFTDGVTDARNPSGEFFSEERLMALLAQPAVSASDLLDRIEADLQAHIAGASQFDDVTMLAMRRLNTSEPGVHIGLTHSLGLTD